MERLSANTALKTNKPQHVTCCRCSLVWSFRPNLSSVKEIEKQFSASAKPSRLWRSRRKALWDRRDLSFPQRLMETRWGPCCRRNGRCQSWRAQALTQNSCDSILASSQECGNCAMRVTAVEDHGRREPRKSAGADGICSWQDLAIYFPKTFQDDVFLELSWQSVWNPCQPQHVSSWFPGLAWRDASSRCRQGQTDSSQNSILDTALAVLGRLFQSNGGNFASMNKNRKERNLGPSDLHRISNASCVHVQVHWSTDKNCANKALHFSAMVLPVPAICPSLGGPDPRKSALIQFLKTGIGTHLEGQLVACWGLCGNLMTRPVSMAPLSWLKKLFGC